MTKSTQLPIAYGKEIDGKVWLQPYKRAGFMRPMGIGIYETREIAEAAAKMHGYQIEWSAA